VTSTPWLHCRDPIQPVTQPPVTGGSKGQGGRLDRELQHQAAALGPPDDAPSAPLPSPRRRLSAFTQFPSDPSPEPMLKEVLRGEAQLLHPYELP
jgi:hypothetical protein